MHDQQLFIDGPDVSRTFRCPVTDFCSNFMAVVFLVLATAVQYYIQHSPSMGLVSLSKLLLVVPCWDCGVISALKLVTSVAWGVPYDLCQDQWCRFFEINFWDRLQGLTVSSLLCDRCHL